MTRVVLFGVPALTVLVVALALVVGAAPRPVTGARLSGGPPDGARLSFRLQVVEQRGDEVVAVPARPVRLELRDGDAPPLVWEGALDGEGAASVSLTRGGSLGTTPTVVITAPWAPAPLALGTLELGHTSWTQGITRRGGWLATPRQGELAVRVAPGRGALAVPFVSPVLVEVRQQGKPAAGVTLEVRGESVDVVTRPRATNSHGRTTFDVRPTAHVASLQIEATAPGATGHLDAALPVVAGALLADWSAPHLIVRAPVPRERAYFALVTEQGRFAGGTVALTTDGRGGATGTVAIGPLPAAPTWAVVSSEDDLASPSSLGWPLTDSRAAFLEGTSPGLPESLTVPDVPLLDGVTPLLREELIRQGRVRRLTALFVVTAMALVVMVLLLRVRDSEQRLRAHLTEQVGALDGAAIAPPRGRGWLGVAVGALCVVLGFLLLVLLSLFRG